MSGTALSCRTTDLTVKQLQGASWDNLLLKTTKNASPVGTYYSDETRTRAPEAGSVLFAGTGLGVEVAVSAGRGGGGGVTCFKDW